MALNSSTTSDSLWNLVGPVAGPAVIGAGNYLGGQTIAGGYNAAGQTIQGGLNTSEAALSPYAYTPQASLSALASLYGLGGAAPNYAAFTGQPGYQFQVQQGDQAINRAAAARGNEFSSSTVASLANYNSGLANSTYQQYLQNLFGLTGLGAGAAQGLGAQALQGTTAIGSTQANAGLATASGINGAAGSLAAIAGKLPWQSIFGSGGNGGNPNVTAVPAYTYNGPTLYDPGNQDVTTTDTGTTTDFGG